MSVQHGLFYFLEETKPSEPVLKLQASYGFQERKHLANLFRAGEGLVGQCMLERILLTRVPENYIKIGSGLGEGTPRNIVVIPVLFEGEVLAIIELATFDQFSPVHLTFLDQLTESIGIVLNTLQANARTEELLKQSQSHPGIAKPPARAAADQRAPGVTGKIAAGLGRALARATRGAESNQCRARG